MKKIMVIALISIYIATISANTIRIAAASNLRYALEDIKNEYIKKSPKSIVNITYGSSGAFVQQIANGAKFDFFMSADNECPSKLKELGYTAGTINVYAYGKLVIFSTSKDFSGDKEAFLRSKSVKKIAIANPNTAPYGERALNWIKDRGYYESLKNKIVMGENISQTAQFVFSGNAEIGFIALSLALTPEMKSKGKYYIIPQSEYKPIEQSCVLIKKTKLKAEALNFKKYVLSDEVKSIWLKHGYYLPKKKTDVL